MCLCMRPVACPAIGDARASTCSASRTWTPLIPLLCRPCSSCSVLQLLSCLCDPLSLPAHSEGPFQRVRVSIMVNPRHSSQPTPASFTTMQGGRSGVRGRSAACLAPSIARTWHLVRRHVRT